MTAQTRETMAGEPRSSSVIVNVIDVLRCFTVDDPLLGVTEIATSVGLHKSSISRILATLEQERIVERDELSRKFRLGMGLIAVAGPLLANLDVRRIAYPVLQELAEATGETAALNIWDGAESVSVEQISSRKQVKHTSPIGTRYGTPLSASVQVFLAHQDEAVVRELLSRAGAEHDPAGPQDVERYLRRLEKVREQGYACNYGETSHEEVGVAAPIMGHRGEVAAALMVAAPLYRIDEATLIQLAETCCRAAARISRRMGGQPE
ncbi:MULTISPECIES: IclR family transcriptional regulator [Micrococcaceae]|uniref:Transcriptional regulator, IclR family n=1 Tax=Arthrobacter rhombi TaxID=71253 RepID=A0A1R4FE38_9MICC|nr:MULTISPECIES: IclR family transcriptional regulator [Micrococcaceae]PCC24573.1 IclR family transcriptional regulator [Glutamicibacter sp. BW78]SJM54113.1 Transcriptional regulator, IclR family [Arthrobacter rhombi]